MTENEILEVLVQADAKLVEYKAIVEPILEEMARLKSLHMYGEEAKCGSHLGCYEEGIQVVCLHPIFFLSKAESYRGYEFMDEWQAKLADRGAEIIRIH